MRIPISVESEHGWLVRPTEAPFVNGFIYLFCTLAPGVLVGMVYLTAAAGFRGLFQFLFYKQPFGDPLTVRVGMVSFLGGAAWSALLWLGWRVRVKLFRMPAPLVYGFSAALFWFAGWVALHTRHL